MSVEAFAMAQAKAETKPSLSPRVDKRLDNGMAMEWVKIKMRQWATAVASNNEAQFQFFNYLVQKQYNSKLMKSNVE
ncbi:hypothetical protein CR513_62805, partial [Mucuna pruriens]